MSKAHIITAGQRQDFAVLSAYARAGLQNAIDLILIHNEAEVRGAQPRTTLNPLIAMLSVAAWERFIADLAALARSQGISAPPMPGTADSKGHSRLKADSNGGRSPAVSALAIGSGGELPGRWCIRIATTGSGKHLSFGQTETGLTDKLANLVDWWVDVRNSAAHRSFPRMTKWLVTTDAGNGQTINTTTARFAFTLFLQLIDQTIQVITETAGFSHPQELWLPQEWLTGKAVNRGVAGNRALWTGRSLVASRAAMMLG